MKIASFSQKELAETLSGRGIFLQTGPFVCHVRSPIPTVAQGLARLYANYSLAETREFADFHLAIVPARGLRRWLAPQVLFSFDGFIPFKPLPLAQAFPMLEWALNWCIANHSNQYLILHAAVVEKHGYAAILPGAPGSGKSTLCAALVNRGWRLLSDELALISTENRRLVPVTRPVSLKNASIEVIRQFAPEAEIGAVTHDTAKGSVAHMKAPADSVVRGGESAQPRWIIFPRYVAGGDRCLQPVSKGHALARVVENAFNYNILGALGFETAANVVNVCCSYDFSYSELDTAIELFEELANKATTEQMNVAP